MFNLWLLYRKKAWLAPVQPKLLLLWRRLWNIICEDSCVQFCSRCHTSQVFFYYDNDKELKACLSMTWLICGHCFMVFVSECVDFSLECTCPLNIHVPNLNWSFRTVWVSLHASLFIAKLPWMGLKKCSFTVHVEVNSTLRSVFSPSDERENGVTITERLNITKYVFINLHYLRLKKIDGGHIWVVAFMEKSSDVSTINFLKPRVM